MRKLEEWLDCQMKKVWRSGWLVACLHASSNSQNFSGQRGIRFTDRPTCTTEWILWHYLQSIMWMSTWLNVLRLCLFCDYRNCSSTSQANHSFPDFSLTNVKFPDFSTFTRWVTTLEDMLGCFNTVHQWTEQVDGHNGHRWIPFWQAPGAAEPIRQRQ